MSKFKEFIKVRVTNSDFSLILKIIDEKNDLFQNEKINKLEHILLFTNLDQLYKFDELIKEKLIYQGFDNYYNANRFGVMCESMIDKLYNIIEEEEKNNK